MRWPTLGIQRHFLAPVQLYYFQLQLMNNIKQSMKCIEIENVITTRVYPQSLFEVPRSLRIWQHGREEADVARVPRNKNHRERLVDLKIMDTLTHERGNSQRL